MPRGGIRPACSVPGCERPHYAHGYCAPHARRFKKHGSPGEDVPFQSKGELSEGREYVKPSNGYTYVYMPGHRLANANGKVPKHRLLYEQYYGVELLKNDRVVFVDGNKRNFDSLNLAIEPRTYRISKCEVCRKPIAKTLYQLTRTRSSVCVGCYPEYLKKTMIGFDNPNCRVSSDEVIDIRILRALGCTVEYLSSRYHLCKESIRGIVLGRRFDDIPFCKGDENEFLMEAIAYRMRTLDESQRG